MACCSNLRNCRPQHDSQLGHEGLVWAASLLMMKAEDVRGALAEGWPELEAALAEHDADPVVGGLKHPEMSHVARFLAERLRAGETDRLPLFFAAVERCLVEGNHDAVSLVTVGLIEDLQNGNVTGFDDYSVWASYLGPKSQQAWQSVEDFWTRPR
jgi:hypothetical protein